MYTAAPTRAERALFLVAFAIAATIAAALVRQLFRLAVLIGSQLIAGTRWIVREIGARHRRRQQRSAVAPTAVEV